MHLKHNLPLKNRAASGRANHFWQEDSFINILTGGMIVRNYLFQTMHSITISKVHMGCEDLREAPYNLRGISLTNPLRVFGDGYAHI